MVTGLMPFEAETIGSLLEKISKCSYSLPSALNASIPREVESVISRCLKKNPSDRYHSVSELLRDVKMCAAESNPANLHRRSVFSLIPNIPIPRYPKPKHAELAVATASHIPPMTASRKWAILSAATCVVLLILVGLYALVGNSPNSNLAAGQMKPHTIKVTGGQADVYENGRRVGTTPYEFTAKVNDQIDVTLRREGYEDCAVRFTVSENKREYLYTMKEKE
jgi:serine/threonine protein kinase